MSHVLVTGAAGFLGSHLVDALVQRKDSIIGLDNLMRGRTEHIQSHIASRSIDFVEGDIRDFETVRRAVAGVDVVFHLAAQSNVMGAVTDPDYSFSTNVTGTYNVLRASAEAGVKRLVFSSSREAYGEPEKLPVPETDCPQPKNMYGASKLAGEAYCRSFNNTTGLRCTILRFGNLYGSRDRDRVIPLWLDQAIAAEPLIVYGGKQVIDFLHVDRAVAALLRASAYEGLGPINVASGSGTSLLDLADRLLGATQSDARLQLEPARSVEVTRFIANVELMRRELALEPPQDPLEGLAAMVEEARHAALMTQPV
jgi:UDP-glucose 4-epimerase